MIKDSIISLCGGRIEDTSIQSPDLNWNLLCDHAIREGLAGYLYTCLKDMKWILPGALDSLRDIYISNTRENLSIYHSLNPVMRLLEEDGIPAIIFRGASLMGDVYPSFGMRGFRDVDILVKEEDMERVTSLLEGTGFASSKPYTVLYRDGLYIDIHTDLMTHSRVKPLRLTVKTDIHALFKRAIEKEIQGVRFFTLAPEDSIISLAVHAQMHSYDRLIGFLDISRSLAFYRDRIDIKRLFHRAREMNLSRTVFYSLFLMPEEWLDSYRSILKVLRPETFQPGEEALLKRLKMGEAIPYAGESLFLLNTRGIWNWIVFIKSIIFPDEEIRLGYLLNPFAIYHFIKDRFIKMVVYLFSLFIGNPTPTDR